MAEETETVEYDDWVECWNCGGEGFSHHDCGEDTCCCLQPENNVLCEICEGKCGWNAETPTEATKGKDA